MNWLLTNSGSAGYSLNNYKNTAMWQLENGATNREPDYFWFNNYLQVPMGGALWWANGPNPTGVLGDRAGIFYISQTNGGQFRLLLSTNGGPWTTALHLNGYSVTPSGHFTNVALPLNRYRLRVESDAGTNFIIGPSIVAANAKGINATFLDWPGIHLGQVTNVSLSIRAPIFAALQPDLLIWHMKEDGSLTTSNRMEECENWWAAAAPQCAVIYIGSTWVSIDATSTYTLDQNLLVRNIALKHHRAYVDLMQPTISYDWLLANGFMADGTHVNSAGGLYCANLMWNDLGFFALGLNKKLSLTKTGVQLNLSYTTSASARYRLEFSTNLAHWTPILTNPVATASFTTNFPTSTAPAFYRLGLTPP